MQHWVTIGLLLLAAPSVALAHGRLKSSTPAAGAHLSTVPRELRFDFSEVPDLTFSAIKLLGPGGIEVVVGPLRYAADSRRSVIVSVLRPLLPGTYVVQWQLAGDDGHPVRGTLDFVIAPGAMGAASAVPSVGGTAASTDSAADVMHHDPASMPTGNGFGADSPIYVLVRWAQFMALLLAVGAISFHRFVLGSLGNAPVCDGAAQRAARVGLGAVGVLLLALVLRLVAQSYAMHGARDAWNVSLSTQMIARTMWGRGWLLQLAGVLVAGVGFSRARLPIERARVAWTVAALGTVLLAFSPAFSGHAAAAPQFRSLAIIADGLHVIGASSWLGSLALVLFAGLPSVRALALPERGPMVARMINAFSPVALASAALAVATGVFAAWLHVGTIPHLWNTRYGITLLVKLAILGVVALTGFYNWRVVKPSLGTEAATVNLARSARVEVAVAVFVLLATAVLVASPTSMDMVM